MAKATVKSEKKDKDVKKKPVAAKAVKSAKAKPVAKAITKPATKSKAKSEKPVDSAQTTEKAELLAKIQCFNHGKKTICANLILGTHKCTAKEFAHGRMATVRIGKKRRCEFYEETTYNG